MKRIDKLFILLVILLAAFDLFMYFYIKEDSKPSPPRIEEAHPVPQIFSEESVREYVNKRRKSQGKSTISAYDFSMNYGGDSYDEGYEEVYDTGDYDDERYRYDEEYALGVDDALDEMED